MSKLIDLTGKQFGQLTAIRRVGSNKSGHALWKCQCSCGNIKIISSNDIRKGRTKSCGCLKVEFCKEKATIHNMSKTSEHRIWCNMMNRCKNPNNKSFKNYGGRGIKVCKEWKNDFMAFYADMGERPSKKYSIERIDNNKGYYKENCRWVTQLQQANNKRNNHDITINGKTMSLFQWAHSVGMSPHTLYSRISRNWPPEKAVFYPVHKISK